MPVVTSSRRSLEVEILRLKNLPQSEDDPDPCTSQVRFALWSDDDAEAVSTELFSSVQAKSNAPHFREALSIPLDDERVTGQVHFTVWEHSRQEAPYILFYGRLSVSYEAYKSRREAVVWLSPFPIDQAMPAPAEDAQAKAPSLHVKVLMPKQHEEEVDPHADVSLPDSASGTFVGSQPLLPSTTSFAWLRLLADKKMLEGYRKALVTEWTPRPPLEAPPASSTKSPSSGRRRSNSVNRRASTATAKSSSDASGAGGGGASKSLKNLGDVILLRWCCHRPHQVLTRLRITAEKYLSSPHSPPPLVFTQEEEVAFRTNTKERGLVVSRMCTEAVYKTGTCAMRDWLERLWVLFAVGIDNDPAGSRTLSYELRKRVQETQFDVEDSIVLQTSLLNLLIPSLSYDKTQAMVEDDARHVPEPTFPGADGGWEQKVTKAQLYFTTVLANLAGSLVDTLTEAEVVAFCKNMKPGVFDAQQRIAKNAKGGIRARLQLGTDGTGVKLGSGINIEHLDKYGNRIRNTQFV